MKFYVKLIPSNKTCFMKLINLIKYELKGLEVPHEIKFVYLKWYCPNNVLKNQFYVSMKRHPMSK